MATCPDVDVASASVSKPTTCDSTPLKCQTDCWIQLDPIRLEVSKLRSVAFWASSSKVHTAGSADCLRTWDEVFLALET